MCNRQRDAPRGAEDAGILGELVDEGSGLGVEAGRLGVDGLQALAGRHEEGAVHHHVPLRPPVPPGPRALLRVHPLRHLRNPYQHIVKAYIRLEKINNICCEIH